MKFFIILFFTLLITCSILFYRYKTKQKKELESFEKFIDEELKGLFDSLYYYYDNFIQDKNIVKENANGLDNIADFFVNEYNNLDYNERLKLLQFSNFNEKSINIHIEILKEEQQGVFRNESYHQEVNKYMSLLYRDLIKTVYPKFYILEKENLDNKGYSSFRAISDYIKFKKIEDPSIF